MIAALFRLERTAVVPLLRVVSLLWLLYFRFGHATPGVKSALSRHPPEILDAPHLEVVLGTVGLWPLPAWLVDALSPTLLVAGLCAAVGLATRLSLLVCFGAFTIMYGVIAGYGFFNHTPALPGQLLLALAVLPGTTSFSVDRLLLALWRRRRGDPRPLLETVWPAVPRFGELGVFAVVGLMYGASGIAKLRADAVDWLNGETLRWYLLGGGRQQYWYGPLGPDGADGTIAGYHYMGQSPPLARWIGSSTPLVLLLAWMTLVLELSAFWCLVLGRWWRVGWVLITIAFHVGIVATLGPGFNEWIMVDTCLVLPFLVEQGRQRSRQRALS